tara:strand:+ start:943 stop:1260 length:318 start_codon:yes stop_codon:yes gene_type:complete
MGMRQELQDGNDYLSLIYDTAKEHNPVSPGSIWFGLSKYGKLKNGKVEIDETESGGYILGEQLGLDKDQVDAIVKYFHERGYLNATLGMKTFRITNEGQNYIGGL